MVMIADEGELAFADSGELLQRGMVDSRRLRLPLLDSTLQEILGVKAELQGLSLRLPMTCSDGEEFDRS
jgi:hypothetical protein